MRGSALIVKNTRVVGKEGIYNADLVCRNGKIEKIGDRVSPDNKNIINGEGLVVLPGLIDIHTHGGNGTDINHADEDGIKRLSAFYASRGVTGFLATVLADSHENMLRSLKVINSVINSSYKGAEILGAHLEGPYLSKEFKGAQPDECIIGASVEHFITFEEACPHIKYITVAAENEGAEEIIAYAAKKGIVVALGHTGADYEKCMQCIKTGAKSAAHLFNAMKPLHQHFPSIIGAALESDMYCEVICDGLHLHPAIIRLIVKTKGIRRVIAITDSVMAAGLPDGNYKLGLNDIVVVNGDARTADGSARAGSTVTMIDTLKNILKFTGIPLFKAVDMVSLNPAELLGYGSKKGLVCEGYDADLTIVDGNLDVKYTISGGDIVYSGRTGQSPV